MKTLENASKIRGHDYRILKSFFVNLPYEIVDNFTQNLIVNRSMPSLNTEILESSPLSLYTKLSELYYSLYRYKVYVKIPTFNNELRYT